MNFLRAFFSPVNFQLLHTGKLTDSLSVDFAASFGMCGFLTSCPEHGERQPQLNWPHSQQWFSATMWFFLKLAVVLSLS